MRSLTLPVRGIDRGKLHSNFDELRGGTRKHEALDILAPRNTPVLAVEDGKIARLFLSDAGGITIYQYDPRRPTCITTRTSKRTRRTRRKVHRSSAAT
jgi:hypothetical protein